MKPPHLLYLVSGLWKRFWLAGCLLLALSLSFAGEPLPNKDEQQPTGNQSAATDRHGDPLPEAAIARLGTTRLRHMGSVSAAAYSADGKHLATAGRDYTVRLWHVSTGKELLRLDVPGGSPPRCVAFSPDEKFLAATSDSILDGRGVTLHLWEIGTGRLRVKHTYPQSLPVGGNSVAFSPDGKLLALAGEALHLVDASTGAEVQRFKEGKPEARSVVFAGDGKKLVALCADSSVQFWQTDADKLLFDVNGSEVAEGFSSLAVAPDGKSIATGGRDGALWIWDTSTGKEIRHIKAHAQLVGSLAYSGDGLLLASGSRDGTVGLWDPQTGKLKDRLKNLGNVDFLALAPDGTSLVTGGMFGSRAVCLLDVATGKDHLDLPGQKRPVGLLTFSADGNTLWSGGREDVLRAWQPTTGKLFRQIELRENERLCAQALDGKLLAIAGDGDAVRLWDGTSNKELHALKGLRDGGVSDAVFSPDAKLLAVVDHKSRGRGEGIVHLWDVATGKEVRQLVGEKGRILALAFSQSGELLVSGGNELFVWDLASGKRLWEAAAESPDAIQSVAFSPDGQMLAVFYSNRGTVSVLETPSGKEVCSLNILTQARDGRSPGTGGAAARAMIAPMAISLAPDGRTLVMGTTATDVSEGTIHFWDLVTGKEFGKLEGHADSVRRFAFSPDGKLLASGSADTTILVWGLEARRPPALPVKKLSSDELNKLWTDLAGDDAGAANQALWVLIGDPEHALPFIEDRLKPVPVVDPKRLEKLLADLDDDDFDVRERASAQLGRLGELAGPALRATLKDTKSLEVRKRIEPLLEKTFTSPVTGERLRSLRTVRVLEQVGSPVARRLLRKLAQGDSQARLTQDALTALQRLEARSPAKW